MLKGILTSKPLLIIFIIITIYVSGRLIIFHQLKKVIVQELADLQKQGIAVHVKGLKVGPWKNRVQFDSVSIRINEADENMPRIQARANKVTLRGISLLQAVVSKQLWVHSVHLTQPFIQTQLPIDDNKKEEVNNKKQPALKKFFIKNLSLEEGSWRLNNHTDTPVRVTTLGSVQLRNFHILNTTEGSLQWKVGKTNLSAIKIDFPKDYYTLFVKEIFYNTVAKKLMIDSINLTPHYNKTAFAQKSGEQKNRLNALIPYLSIEDCQMESAPQFKLHAKKASLQLRLESYMDKRYPSRREATKVLPITFLQELPMDIQIDTLRLEDSYAEHEEFPEVGEETGKVFFTKLNATITNLSSKKPTSKDKLPSLSVTALFMGTGDLRAEFSFPESPEGVYYVSGGMYNFPFTKLNTVTEPLAKARIESGQLHSVKFNFQYNNDRSNGKVIMNYNDLEVYALKKDDSDKKAGFKSFILNNFILKKDLDETVAEDKRTGNFEYYRDRRRSVIYYWWKSILAGALAVYNIDNLPASKDNKSDKSKK